ncbi:recombinase RecT [Halomonas sp. I1]|uniref:recombinase RecT n=1 Tax=Halomonas sp. I1 TaxID=393536 RepID=UPI0028E08D3E|nr:recombinase RecT [Halomonas sp. I1]MDT8894229.1 recombinase RecT [Halomonas sp. I1]
MTQVAHQQQEAPSPLAVFTHSLDKREDQFKQLLDGTGIDFSTFRSAALTGVQANPDLLHADPASLFDALSQSCRDGLLPDNRQGALVIHSTNTAKREEPPNWVQKVAWMPMIRGLLSKIRNAPEVANVHMDVVYQDDTFDYWVDEDGQHLKHRPKWGGDRGDDKISLAYATVRLKSGEVQIEVVARADLEKIQAASKSGRKGYGPWKDWKPQMCKKSAMHRLAPKLPLPDAVMKVINRDEQLYDFEQRKEQDVTPQQPQVEALPPYSDESFKGNFEQWRAAILAGKTSPERVIAKVSSRAMLSDEQKQQIQNITAEASV